MKQASKLIAILLALVWSVAVVGRSVSDAELSLGGIALGDTEASILERFGEPEEIRDTGESWLLRYHGLSIWVGFLSEGRQVRRVLEILSTNPIHCTPSGVCPGADIQVATAAYGAAPLTERDEGSFFEYGADQTACWLQIRPEAGRIRSIRVECQP